MIYKAIADGDFSTLAIWQMWNGTDWINATVLPSFDDDVYSNNFIVTITSDVFVNSLNRSSLSSPVITEGGQFQITGANEITLSGQVNGSNVAIVANTPLSACVNRLATHTNKFHRIGDDVGGNRNNSFGFWNDSAYNIDIIGNQRGGSGSAAWGFYNNASSTFSSIIGNQTGGTGNSARGFSNNAMCIFESIIGNQIGGSGAGAYGFYNAATNSNIKIKGIATASSVAAIANTQTSSYIYFEGSVINSLGVMAIFSPTIYLNVNPDSVWKWSNLIGEDQFLYGAGHQLGNPLNRDVRKDTIFGSNGELIGTLAVPPPESVVKNVPTDDTVGEWEFDDDLIERLRHCATTEIVDVQLASYQNT
jgi:hypothetical protein